LNIKKTKHKKICTIIKQAFKEPFKLPKTKKKGQSDKEFIFVANFVDLPL